MSNDNFAIEIDPPDDAEYDVEAGINSSTCHLMHSFEEERPTSLVASLRESAKSSKRKVTYYCSFIFSPIRKLLATFKLLIIIGLYSFAGAHLFMYLEVPTDLEAKEDGYHQRKIAREVMVLNLRAIHYDNREDREERWKHAILKFEADMGLDEPVIETAWTFWMSFLYAGTIFTTIGYGNIACKTRAGQIATMIYAFAGIPIMLVMLTSLNNFLLKWIKIITNGFCDIFLYVGVRLGVAVIRQDEVQKRLRYTRIAKKMGEWRLAKHGGSIAISSSEENRLNSCPEDEEEEDMEPDPPVFSTLFATVSWIMLSAGVFCLFEDWTFFTSFYFCFISLTTIGLGDVTPANPEYMIATFGVVIIGLSMLTVCIDVIKEKLAQMYMALLQKLLKDYMEAVKSGDPNAASAMMAGFQGKAKFLMPLISKNEGAKVMSKFKQDCSKKGIDPPPVLTNINPETGMPAFANASRQDFNDYIEVAEEKFAEEQQKLVSQTPLSKSTDFLQPPSRKASVTSSPPPRVSLEVQAGSTMGRYHDYGSQTQNESSDEGIQTDYSLDLDADKSKEPEKVMADAGTQYEIILLTSIGIQPEVSSIYIGAEASSAEDEESGCESEEEYSSEDEDLPFDVEDPGVLAFGLQSPPIEITPFTDDESGNSEARSSPRPEGIEDTPIPTIRSKLTPAKVEKSASMDSTDTVIHVKPSEEKVEVIEEEKALEEKTSEKRRRKKKKLKTKKTREHELRFLKNSGNQTSPILLDCATQYEIFTTESSSQYDVKGRSRKCQTKLSSINHEQLQGIRETVQKLKRRESEMSRVTNVSESDWESESGAKEEVAEISLDLSVIALGVDESGKVVEVPKLPKEVPRSQESSQMDEAPKPTSLSESMSLVHLDSEEEEIESLEELEMFSTDTGAQTEEKVMVDKQAHTTPRNLEILRNCTTQTTFSTFHLPEKVYESASTSSGEEDEDEKEEHVFFMTNTGVQTMHTSFHLEPKPEIQEEEGLQKESEDQKIEEDLPLFLKDSDCQTMEMETSSCETATEYVKFAEEKEMRDSLNQTAEVIYFDTIMQTDQASINEESSQTEVATSSASESQTEPLSSSEVQLQTDALQSAPVQCQTDSSESLTPSKPETSISESQTDAPSSSEVEVQAILSVESTPVECQTESVHLDEVEVQTEVESWTTWAQTEFVGGDDVEMQTDENETMASESQTERIPLDDTEMQTDDRSLLTSESQTEAVSTDLQYTQTDDESPDVSEAFTQYESTQLTDSETQYKIDSEDVDVQAKPISLDTQTQHSIELDAKSCQTELVTKKNKRSQDEEDSDEDKIPELLKIDNESQIEIDRSSINLSPIQLDVTHSFTMTDPGSSEEKEVQVDEDSFEDPDSNQPKYMSGPLWSDFDYTPVIDDEEVVDGETQTEDGSEEEEVEETKEAGEEDSDSQEDSEDLPRDSEAIESSEADAPEISKTPRTKGSRKAKGSSVKTTKTSKSTKSEKASVGTGGTDYSKRPGSSEEPPSASASSEPQDSLTDEFAIQCSPESSDVKTQTVKFKKRAEEKNVEARVEMSTSTVQATTEMCEQSAGSIGEDDWLQVYVQELDEERRLRMSDIGIQTGVLARVQHMYTRPISDAVDATSSAPITLRKSSDSSEHISVKTAKSSEESLGPSVSGTAMSAAESMDDHLWPERVSPFASRHGSMKRGKREREEEKKGDKSNIVHDLRAKFEMKSPPKSPKDEERKSFF